MPPAARATSAPAAAGDRQQLVDPRPAVDRLALADEVRPARHGRARPQRINRQEMGRRGVLDIHRVDHILAVADAAQSTSPGAIDHVRNKIAVARPPNQMRPQRAA